MSMNQHDSKNEYGTVVVSGQATALLGNSYSSQVIEHLHVYLPAAADRSDQNRTIWPFKLLGTVALNAEDAACTTTSSSRDTAPKATSQGNERKNNNDIKRALLFLMQNAGRVGLQPARIHATIQHVLAQLSLRTTTLTKVEPNDPNIIQYNPRREKNYSPQCSTTSLVLPTNCVRSNEQQKILRDFLKLCALFVSLFIWRTASVADLFEILARMQTLVLRLKDDKMTACLSLLLAVLALNFLPHLHSNRSLSVCSGDHVLLEDMYGCFSSVPLCVFEGPNILKGFLLDRFKNSNAELFIENGNYNISLGRRDGPAWETDSSESGERLIPNIRMVMAVHWQSLVQTCPDCQHQLDLFAGNYLTCNFCRRSYLVRECPPVRKLVRSSTSASTSHQHNSTMFDSSPKASNEKLGAIKNVDFDISILCLRSASQAVEVEESSSLDGSASEDELDDLFADDDDDDWNEDHEEGQEYKDDSSAPCSGKSLDERINELVEAQESRLLQQLQLEESQLLGQLQLEDMDDKARESWLLQQLALRSRVDEELDYLVAAHAVSTLGDAIVSSFIRKWLGSRAQVSHSHRIVVALLKEIVCSQMSISHMIRSIRCMGWLSDPAKHMLIASAALSGEEKVQKQGQEWENSCAILGALLLRLQRDHAPNITLDNIQHFFIETFPRFEAISSHNYLQQEKTLGLSIPYLKKLNVWNPELPGLLSFDVLFSPDCDLFAISVDALSSIGTLMREASTLALTENFDEYLQASVSLKLVISGCDRLINFSTVSILSGHSMRKLCHCEPDMVIGRAVPEQLSPPNWDIVYLDMLYQNPASFYTFFPA